MLLHLSQPAPFIGVTSLASSGGEAGLHQRRAAACGCGSLQLRADAAHEALGADQVHRAGDEERLDAHVHQAVDGARRVVGVQRGEHQVAGERRLDRDFRGLEVADFADQDDVRVLAQEGAQRRGEVEADVLAAPAPG